MLLRGKCERAGAAAASSGQDLNGTADRGRGGGAWIRQGAKGSAGIEKREEKYRQLHALLLARRPVLRRRSSSAHGFVSPTSYNLLVEEGAIQVLISFQNIFCGKVKCFVNYIF